MPNKLTLSPYEGLLYLIHQKECANKPVDDLKRLYLTGGVEQIRPHLSKQLTHPISYKNSVIHADESRQYFTQHLAFETLNQQLIKLDVDQLKFYYQQLYDLFLGQNHTKKLGHRLQRTIERAHAVLDGMVLEECGLMKALVNPFSQTSAEREALFKNHPTYVLFQNELFYIDKHAGVERLSVPSEHMPQLSAFFTSSDNERQEATRESLAQIRALSNHQEKEKESLHPNKILQLDRAYAHALSAIHTGKALVLSSGKLSAEHQQKIELLIKIAYLGLLNCNVHPLPLDMHAPLRSFTHFDDVFHQILHPEKANSISNVVLAQMRCLAELSNGRTLYDGLSLKQALNDLECSNCYVWDHSSDLSNAMLYEFLPDGTFTMVPLNDKEAFDAQLGPYRQTQQSARLFLSANDINTLLPNQARYANTSTYLETEDGLSLFITVMMASLVLTNPNHSFDDFITPNQLQWLQNAFSSTPDLLSQMTVEAMFYTHNQPAFEKALQDTIHYFSTRLFKIELHMQTEKKGDDAEESFQNTIKG